MAKKPFVNTWRVFHTLSQAKFAGPISDYESNYMAVLEELRVTDVAYQPELWHNRLIAPQLAKPLASWTKKEIAQWGTLLMVCDKHVMKLSDAFLDEVRGTITCLAATPAVKKNTALCGVFFALSVQYSATIDHQVRRKGSAVA